MSVGQDVPLVVRFCSAWAGPANLGHGDWLSSAPEDGDRGRLAGRVRAGRWPCLSLSVVDLLPDDQGSAVAGR